MLRVLEIDWFARAYGWEPEVTLRQPRQVMADLRALRGYRAAMRSGDG